MESETKLRKRLPMYQQWLFISLALLPIFTYFIYLTVHTANLPNEDDVPAILKAVTDYFSGRNDLLDVLFRRHNIHPILLVRLSALTQVLLTGQVNFKILALVGNLSLMGIALILWKIYNRNKQSLLYFLPVCFILFQAQLVSSSIWTMVVWSNIMVIFTAFLSLWWLSRQGKYYIYLSCLLLFVTVFTNGNGLLIIPSGIVVLILCRAEIPRWICWLAVSGLSFFLFSTTGESVSLPPLSFSILVVVFVNSAAFLGAYISLIAHYLDFVCVGIGFLLISLFIYYLSTSLFYRFRTSNSSLTFVVEPVHCGMIVFLLLTAFSVALLRNEGFNVTQMLFGRYRQYSAVSMCLGYLITLYYLPPNTLKFRFYFALTLAFSVVWNIGGYVRYDRFVSYYSRDIQSFTYNMFYNDASLLHTSGYDSTNFTPFFQEAIKKGYFHSPLNQFPTPTEILYSIEKQGDVPISINKKADIESVNDYGCHKKLVLNNYGVNHSKYVLDAEFEEELYLAFRQKNHLYLVACSSTIPLFRKKRNAEWQAQLPLCRLSPGNYQVSLLSIVNDVVRANRISFELIIPQSSDMTMKTSQLTL